MKKQRRFTREFEDEAVRLARTSGRTQREVADDLGIGLSTLVRWIGRSRDRVMEAPDRADGQEDAAAELKRLRRENEILRQEREILKRAATFFAKEGSRFKALHLSFASSKRLMRILRSIVGTQSLLVQSREANFAKRRSVGSEFVGDDNLRNEALTSKQCPEQPQRRGFIALGLDQDLKNLAFAVDGAPHVHFLSRERDHHFIEMPLSVSFRP